MQKHLQIRFCPSEFDPPYIGEEQVGWVKQTFYCTSMLVRKVDPVKQNLACKRSFALTRRLKTRAICKFGKRTGEASNDRHILKRQMNIFRIGGRMPPMPPLHRLGRREHNIWQTNNISRVGFAFDQSQCWMILTVKIIAIRPPHQTIRVCARTLFAKVLS